VHLLLTAPIACSIIFQIIIRGEPVLASQSCAESVPPSTKGAVTVSNIEDTYLLLASAISECMVNLPKEPNNRIPDADYVAKVS